MALFVRDIYSTLDYLAVCESIEDRGTRDHAEDRPFSQGRFVARAGKRRREEDL
jgi:hypothetical protein